MQSAISKKRVSLERRVVPIYHNFGGVVVNVLQELKSTADSRAVEQHRSYRQAHY